MGVDCREDCLHLRAVHDLLHDGPGFVRLTFAKPLFVDQFLKPAHHRRHEGLRRFNTSKRELYAELGDLASDVLEILGSDGHRPAPLVLHGLHALGAIGLQFC